MNERPIATRMLERVTTGERDEALAGLREQFGGGRTDNGWASGTDEMKSRELEKPTDEIESCGGIYGPGETAALSDAAK